MKFKGGIKVGNYGTVKPRYNALETLKKTLRSIRHKEALASKNAPPVR